MRKLILALALTTLVACEKVNPLPAESAWTNPTDALGTAKTNLSSSITALPQGPAGSSSSITSVSNASSSTIVPTTTSSSVTLPPSSSSGTIATNISSSAILSSSSTVAIPSGTLLWSNISPYDTVRTGGNWGTTASLSASVTPSAKPYLMSTASNTGFELTTKEIGGFASVGFSLKDAYGSLGTSIDASKSPGICVAFENSDAPILIILNKGNGNYRASSKVSATTSCTKFLFNWSEFSGFKSNALIQVDFALEYSVTSYTTMFKILSVALGDINSCSCP